MFFFIGIILVIVGKKFFILREKYFEGKALRFVRRLIVVFGLYRFLEMLRGFEEDSRWFSLFIEKKVVTDRG